MAAKRKEAWVESFVRSPHHALLFPPPLFYRNEKGKNKHSMDVRKIRYFSRHKFCFEMQFC